MALEQKRIDLINSNRLRNLKDDLITDSQLVICGDTELKSLWRNLYSHEELDNLSHSKIQMEVVDGLFDDVVKRYLNMGSAQFLRDLRRDLHVQKTEAHRKKTFEKSKQKELKGAKVCLEDILKDESLNKVISNKFLQAMLIKYPDILASRIYKKQELSILCDLYGLQMFTSSDKATMSKELVQTIMHAQDMRKQGKSNSFFKTLTDEQTLK
jgi:hypothetical protein